MSVALPKNAGSSGRHPSRWLALGTNATLIYPIIVVAALYAEWLLAWHLLGRQPSTIGDDDPEQLPTWWLHNINWLLFLGILPVSFAAVILNVGYIINFSPSAVRAGIRIQTLVGLWLWMYSMLAWYMPDALMEWWRD